MPISKPHSTLGASNTSSCIDLAMYLEKENNDLDKLLQKTKSIEGKRNIENRKQFFFNHSENLELNLNTKSEKPLKKKEPKLEVKEKEIHSTLEVTPAVHEEVKIEVEESLLFNTFELRWEPTSTWRNSGERSSRT